MIGAMAFCVRTKVFDELPLAGVFCAQPGIREWCRASRSPPRISAGKAGRNATHKLTLPPTVQSGPVYPAGMVMHAPRVPQQLLPLPEGDSGTGVTVQHMIDLIEAGKKDQTVNRAVAAIVRHVPQHNRLAEAAAVFNWARRNIRFTSDTKGVETLRSPDETLRVGIGDCDDFVILICSLLESVGHTMRIITVASDPRDPSIFTHVYPEDYIRGRWVALDAARRNPLVGKRPSRIFRVRAWEMDGSYFDLAPQEYLGGGGDSGAGDPRFGASAGGTWGMTGAPWAAARSQRRMDGLGSLYLGQDDLVADITALTPLITAGTTGAANIIRATNAPAIPYGYTVGPGGVIQPTTATATLSTSANLTQYMPLLLIGGLLLAFMAMRNQ